VRKGFFSSLLAGGASRAFFRDAERYAKHRNVPEDPGYRAFLDRLLVPLCARLPKDVLRRGFGVLLSLVSARMIFTKEFPARIPLKAASLDPLSPTSPPTQEPPSPAGSSIFH